MSKLANFLSEEKHEFSSMLSVSADLQPDSQFFSIRTGKEIPVLEYIGWGERQKPIGTLSDDKFQRTPVLNLHLDSKEAIAVQELDALLQTMNKADYFSDGKKLILLGDLNLDLANRNYRLLLADIFERNAIITENVSLEVPVERERSIDIALNQQPHKGGLKKIDVKNAIFVLRRKQASDRSVAEQLDSAYEALPSPKKMGEDGFDHSPVALNHNNTLYISISNLPTQPGGKVSTNDVIMTEEARKADLELREYIRKTVESVFNVQVDDLKEYAKSLNEVLEMKRRFSVSDLEFAKFLINRMDQFINTVINSDEFYHYATIRVTNQFSDKHLRKEILGDFFRKSDKEYNTVFDLFSDLNPVHRVSKAIRQIIVDDKPHAMKVERLLTNFFEMISPQPNNGYEPAVLGPREMEKLRIDMIRHLVMENTGVGQVKIFCNDTVESDYHSFRAALTDMLKTCAINHESIELPRRHSLVSAFFRRFGNSCCSSREDVEPRDGIRIQK